MIRRVRLENFRSFMEADIDLGWFTVLLGPNSAGKSNLFYGLATLGRVADHPLLAPSRRPGAAAGGPTRFLKTQRAVPEEPTFPTGSEAVPFDQVVRGGDQTLAVRLMVELERDDARGAYDVQFGRYRQDVLILEERLQWEDAEYSARFDSREDVLRAVKGQETRMWAVPRAQSAPFLLYHFRLEPESAPLAPAAVRLREALRLARYRFDPWGIKRPAEPGIQMRPNGYGLGSKLDDLQADRARFAELEQAFRSFFPNFEQIVIPSPRVGVNQLAVVEQGHTMPADCISDGALLCLAILYLVFDPDPPPLICLEEPENGLHPHLLHELVSLLRRVSQGEVGPKQTQILVSTHSPEFLRWCEPSEVYLVERTSEGTQFQRWPAQFGKEELSSRYRMAMSDAWLSGAVGGVPVEG